MRQAVIGLTTAVTLPVVGYLVDKDLTAACGGVVALLALGAVANMGVARREKVSSREGNRGLTDTSIAITANDEADRPVDAGGKVTAR